MTLEKSNSEIEISMKLLFGNSIIWRKMVVNLTQKMEEMKLLNLNLINTKIYVILVKS